MNRRQVLAATTSALALAGCLDNRSEPVGTDPSSTTEPPSGAYLTHTTTSDFCSAATTPMSRQFVEKGGDEYCFEGAEPSLAVENERDDGVALVLEVASGGESTFEEAYNLEPGERVVEHGVISAHDDYEVSVAVDDEIATGSWEGTSCFRHGIAVTTEVVVFGLVPPLSGPGDTQHDCYAGDDAHLSIYNGSEAQSVVLRVFDRCADSTVEESFQMESEAVEHASDVLVAGGNYDVTIDVSGGGSETYEFREECWGLTAAIDEDGNVTIRQMEID